MTRVRIAVIAIGLALTLAAVPVGAQETTDPNAPAVVVEEGAPVPVEDAWTFRFLVPTVLAISGAALLAALVGYRARLGRYRVVR